MLRRTPLKRGYKPLKANKPLQRHTGLPQVGRKRREKAEASGKPVRATLATRYTDTGPDQLTVAAILERAQHSCERCSEPVGDRRGTDWHCHHRRPRAAGGSKRDDTNSPSNCTVLCPRCHTDVESYRATALTECWLLQQANDPAKVPLLIERGARWVYLTADGQYGAAPPHDPMVAAMPAGEEF